MKISEKMIMRELNTLSEEVFRLYSMGMYQEASQKATHVIRIAKEKLGQWHPSLKIYYDNLQMVKSAQKGFVSTQKDYNSKDNQKSRDVLSQSTNTFENNQSKQLKQVNVYHPKNKSKDISFRKYLKKLIFISSFLMIIPIIFLFFLLSDTISFPSFKVASIGNIFSPNLIENYSYELKKQSLIEAPLIQQYPELPRGCEVTSLAMLLQYAGVDVDKLTLAKKIKKDNTRYQVVNGNVFFGNPDYGFVGDMYSKTKPGLGVYHGPIQELAEKYLPNQIVDLTGRPFKDIFYFLNADIPVWVIINTDFSELSDKDFEVWYTTYGPVQITYKQHSVLLTGYDEKYVYFNDPLDKKRNRQIFIEEFEKAWEQMGRQAVSYVPANKKLIEILPLK